jgi:hypothetical protein
MSLTTATMASAALKKALGFANTDVSKAISNEQYRTGFSTSLSSVFGDAVPVNPAKTNLYDTTNGVVEFVRLQMTLDPTSNGHAYFASLPAAYTTSSTNPLKSSDTVNYANGKRLVDTAGVIQIVPSSFDPKYEVIPYSGGTAVKGSGTVIPPADARDWFIDPYNGVFFQQGSGADSVVSYIECYIWIGGFLTDRLSLLHSGSFTNTSTVALLNTQYYVVDSQTAILDPNFTVASWYVSAQYNDQAFITQVEAILRNGVVKFNMYGTLSVGAPLFKIDCQVFNNSTIQLVIKPTVNNLTVNAKRLAVY